MFDQTNISDEVIDGLIYLQCENFPHIYPIPSQITGKILDGSTRAQSAYFLKKNIFQMYEKLIGACLENGSHWTLFVSCTDFALSLVHDTFQCPSLGKLKAQAYHIHLFTKQFCDIPKRTIVYMNSFGESEVRKSAVLKNWSSFASARGCTGEWTLSHVSHPHQQDGNSCGVHVIMVLKTIALTYIRLPNLSLTVKHKWRSTTLKSQSSDRTRKCSQCWCVIAAKDRVQCQKCGAYKHMRCSKSVCGICIFCEIPAVLPPVPLSLMFLPLRMSTRRDVYAEHTSFSGTPLILPINSSSSSPLEDSTGPYRLKPAGLGTASSPQLSPY
ncbi:uncharacterized protein LOC113016265 isoform X2 [Astatotilapia calliptera]|uniref:uncharacterized protein LOC113016265 isoform X2 n=1 Tax=Astatotilapia calliptera TaxID=8154 RepID=UPI000E41D4DE|nr:uncharacterized protein LOC113016265 isoform X2 [Astatotilapia calliptera]